ncbi:MAG TPA: PAS domain S-box protein, partial [Sphingobacteriaceae bacterium]
ISDRVEAENRIQEIKTNLRAVFESAVEGFIVTDEQLYIQSFNTKALELFFGQRHKNKLETGRNILEYLDPERKHFFVTQIRRVLAGEVVEYERKHDTSAGPQWLRYAIYPVREDDRVTRICIVGRDQTKTIQAEEQLKNSERLFKTLVQEGSDLINVIDLEGNYKYLSQSVNSVLSSKAAEFLGKNAFDLVHPDDRAKLYEEFQALKHVKRAKSTPYRFHVGNGNYRWIETVATNLMDEPGIEGIVINSHDITDTIDHLRSIEQQNERLQEIAWLQAHKVRAPLSSILGIIDLFGDDLDSAQVQELLRLLKQSAIQLDDIIREIIERSRAGSPERNNRPSPHQ